MSVPAHTKRPRLKAWRPSWSNHAWCWAVPALVVVAGIGCSNPIGMMSFLAAQASNNTQAPDLCSFAIDGKESKVLILAAHENLLPNQAFRDAHREISRKLAQILDQRFKEDNAKISVIPVSKVFSYMDDHNEWITEPKQALGKRFGADFVIFLELGEMTLYEKLSHNTLYRGTVEVQISVYDVHGPDGEGKIKEDVYNCTYPESCPEDTTNISPGGFRMKFLDRVARDLAQKFAPHPSRDMVNSD
jgi:hypothetical protein